MPTSEEERKRIEWLAEHPGEPYPEPDEDGLANSGGGSPPYS